MEGLKKLMRRLSKSEGAGSPSPEKDVTTAFAVVTMRTWNR